MNIPGSRKDAHEKLSIQNDLFALLGVKDGDPRYSDCLLVADYIAQQNQQAVQKALEGLLEQKILVLYIASMKDRKVYSETPSEAVPVSTIQAALAADQPRKDGDENS